MKKLALFSLLLITALLLTANHAAAQDPAADAEGCKDYPLFNRMPNHHIYECQHLDFESRNFPIGPGLPEGKTKLIEVEGAFTFLKYELNEGAKPLSGLQLMRNFENATRKAGGTIQGTYPDWCQTEFKHDSRFGNNCTNWSVSMKFTVSGKEVFAYMQRASDTSYGFYVIERQGMNQNIVISAADLQQGLKDTGHIAVYDILFDTGKSDINPESEKSLKEIGTLMSQNASLKLHVVGHTDNVGDIAMNMKLSQARAAAVVAALTGKYGVAAARLSAFGAGPYAPVASNKTDEGKAKNRRVELVEQ
jgi:OmpA-OmpF porin, OOP family